MSAKAIREASTIGLWYGRTCTSVRKLIRDVRGADRPHDGIHPAGRAGLVRVDGLDDEVPERREREADADAHQRRRDQQLPLALADREQRERDSGDRGAGNGGALRSEAVRDLP